MEEKQGTIYKKKKNACYKLPSQKTKAIKNPLKKLVHDQGVLRVLNYFRNEYIGFLYS